MAANNQLERISDLVSRLGPLAHKQRGMRIEADEWNAMVDVLTGVLGVDRFQEESTPGILEQRFALKDHEHLGEVTLTWLDADLQSRLANGQGSISTRTVLAEMDQKLQSLSTELARLSSLAEFLQKTVDRSTADSADRAKTLGQFETRFASVENLRTTVTTFGGDLEGIRGNVTKLLELRKSLSDSAGNPIDISKIRTEVTDLQALRENFKGVDGNLLRMRDIEIKLGEVASASGIDGPGGLDRRLADASSAVEVRLNTRMDEKETVLRKALEDQNAGAETRLRGELSATVDTKVGTLGQSLNTRLEEVVAQSNASFDSKFAGASTALRTDLTSSTTALVESRLATVPNQIRATTDELVAAARTELTGQLQLALTRDLQTRFDAFQTNADGRITKVEGNVASFAEELPRLVGGSVGALRDELQTSLNNSLTVRFDNLRSSLESGFPDRIQSIVRETVGDLDARISAAVGVRLSGLDDAIKKAVTEATRTLPDEIASEVQSQIKSLDIAGQIKTSNANIAADLRAEQAQAAALQQSRFSDSLNSTVTVLRGEIAASRDETNSSLNTRINTVDSSLRKQLTTDVGSLESRIKPESLKTTQTLVIRQVRAAPGRRSPK